MKHEKILLATDFSKQANNLIETAKRLKETGLKKVILVHVINTERIKFEFFDTSNSINQDYKEREKKLLLKEKERLESLGLDVEPLILVGSPAEKIVETAEAKEVDLILIASHGKGYIKELLLGSTTLKVIRVSKVPVLLENYKENKKEVETSYNNKFNKVLIPIDFSELSKQLIGRIKDSNKAIKNLLLLSIIERSNNQGKLEKMKLSTKDKLKKLKTQLEKNGINVEIKVKVGKPAKGILETAQKEDVSLIMMPTRGMGKIKEFMIGSTANSVIRNSEREVMIFPSRSLLTSEIKQKRQDKALKKSTKLVSELMSLYFELGIKQVKINVEHKSAKVIISTQGKVADLSFDKLEELDSSLNVSRVTQVEEYYWELVGESSSSTELSLIGMITDKAEVEYEDDILQIKIHMEDK
ncbi:universal stress protein [Natroniella sp. ANB-PHB2]|uniref:universal stress protein n=1 Tax=Natroniella sp. ANB-PHB2 TaxID=3384444 RepID=UPI0038D3FA69